MPPKSQLPSAKKREVIAKRKRIEAALAKAHVEAPTKKKSSAGKHSDKPKTKTKTTKSKQPSSKKPKKGEETASEKAARAQFAKEEAEEAARDKQQQNSEASK